MVRVASIEKAATGGSGMDSHNDGACRSGSSLGRTSTGETTTEHMTPSRWSSARRYGLLGAVAVVGLAAPLTPLTANATSHAAVAPTLLSTIGGPEHAQVYPSGDEIVPASAGSYAGNLVVSDIGNNVIDEFTPTGTLVWQVGTFGAGTNQFDNPRDVGVDSAGNVFVADAGNSRIVKLNANGSWNTSWTNGGGGTTMNFPLGVSVANNQVYVADTGRKLVRVFDDNGNSLASFGSNGACIIGGLRDVDADAAGNIYVANYENNNILKFTPTGTCITTWGKKGSANGQFRAVYGVTLATDPVAEAAGKGTQEVYTADSQNNRMEEFTTSGVFIASAGIAGTPTQPGTLAYTRRVAVDASGNVWIADLWAWRIEKWTRTSTLTTYTYSETIGTPLPPPTSAAVFQEVHQVAFETSGGVVTAIDAMDTVHHRLVRFSPSGALLNTCGTRSEGTAVPGYNWPRGVAVDPATGQIWTLDTKAYRVEILNPDCTAVAVFGSTGTGLANFDWAYQIAIRGSDEVAWIADTWNNRIVSYGVTSRLPIATSAKGMFSKPAGIAIDPVNGNILVADSGNNRIIELSDNHGMSPTKVQTFTGGLSDPQGVAADAAGNVYVADTNNNRVVVFSPSGAVLTTFTGSFNLPEAIALDPSGNIYVSDTFNDRIQVYGPLS
jgi:DNA-binding beta-propeller fold protein YncE